jgi:hypothetical protein
MADPDVEDGTGRPADPDAFAWVEGLDPGVSLLVAGPPMTGKRRVMHRLVAGERDPDRARLLVTTRKPADRIEREYREVHPDVPRRRLAVVDCVSEGIGSDTVLSDTRRFGHDPGDLTGAGMHVSEFMRRFGADPEVAGVSVGLHTLSTMLMYADLRRVYQFLHVLVGRIEASGSRGTFVVDERRESQRFRTLAGPFDGLVEVRERDGREFRVRGVEAGPRTWTPF